MNHCDEDIFLNLMNFWYFHCFLWTSPSIAHAVTFSPSHEVKRSSRKSGHETGIKHAPKSPNIPSPINRLLMRTKCPSPGGLRGERARGLEEAFLAENKGVIWGGSANAVSNRNPIGIEKGVFGVASIKGPTNCGVSRGRGLGAPGMRYKARSSPGRGLLKCDKSRPGRNPWSVDSQPFEGFGRMWSEDEDVSDNLMIFSEAFVG